VSGWWEGTPVLVTGAQGFIGSWVAERLLDEGATVLVLQRRQERPSRFRLRGLAERCRTVRAELLDPAELRRVLHEHGVRAVFHLAACTSVGGAAGAPLATFEVNTRGTWSLLEACRSVPEAPERVVVASTVRAYGVQEELPYVEDMELRPVYTYDVSKACADHIARSYAAMFDLPVAVTRFANVFGGGDFNLSRLVPGTAAALASGRAPVVRSDGRAERDFLYVEDAVSAYMAVAESLAEPRHRGRAWNAGLGHPLPVLEVVRALIATSGVDVEPEIRGEARPEGEVPRYWLDSSAIRRELGWSAEWDLQRGLEATYDWYAENRDATGSALPTTR
jgi:CDP-glucose 4,6-dehydratase